MIARVKSDHDLEIELAIGSDRNLENADDRGQVIGSDRNLENADDRGQVIESDRNRETASDPGQEIVSGSDPDQRTAGSVEGLDRMIGSAHVIDAIAVAHSHVIASDQSVQSDLRPILHPQQIHLDLNL